MLQKAALLFAVALAGTACGTRVARPDASLGPVVPVTTAPVPVTGDGYSPGSVPVATTGGSAPHTPGARGASPIAAGGRRAGVSDPPAGAISRPVDPTGAAVETSSALASPRSATDPGHQGVAPAGPGPGPGEPIRIATVGTLSGPVGTVVGGSADGVKVWVRHINSMGGIGGRQVKLTVVDDAGDPARHRAAVQQQVEVDKAIAFVGNPEAATGKSSVEYLTAKRVPVVGSDTASSWFHSSPMYFPQAASGDLLPYAQLPVLQAQAKPRGLQKLGWIACVEGQVCEDFDRIWGEYADDFGFQVAYRSRTSLAQPDFTAECLAARNAGTQLLAFALDQNSVVRAASACARQGFHPVYSVAASIVSPTLVDHPDLEGVIGLTNLFPFFETNTPGTAEFAQAMRSFAPNLEYGESQATGWVAAKLFEKAATGMAEPTSAALLAGLWSIRNDTLGGLTAPLTFTTNQPAPRDETCMFAITIQQARWVSSDNFALHCHPVDNALRKVR